jgi:DNA-binding NarL/FixJ family response regulator
MKINISKLAGANVIKSTRQANQQIAAYLNIRFYTVETHCKHIMRKLHLKSPVALIKFILNNDL